MTDLYGAPNLLYGETYLHLSTFDLISQMNVTHSDSLLVCHIVRYVTLGWFQGQCGHSIHILFHAWRVLGLVSMSYLGLRPSISPLVSSAPLIRVHSRT